MRHDELVQREPYVMTQGQGTAQSRGKMPEHLGALTEGEAHQVLVARLYVGRLGEADVHGWWQTDGLLGSDGAYVGPRVLPLTHGAARARIVLAVAKHACEERHPDPGVTHLFDLGPMVEDVLDVLLARRLSDDAFWSEHLARLETVGRQIEPQQLLIAAGIVKEDDLKLIEGLPLGPGGRSLTIPRAQDSEGTVRRLAAGFLRSAPRNLVVPFLEGRGQT